MHVYCLYKCISRYTPLDERNGYNAKPSRFLEVDLRKVENGPIDGRTIFLTDCRTVQGSLDHKKSRPPRTLQ